MVKQHYSLLTQGLAGIQAVDIPGIENVSLVNLLILFLFNVVFIINKKWYLIFVLCCVNRLMLQN